MSFLCCFHPPSKLENFADGVQFNFDLLHDYIKTLDLLDELVKNIFEYYGKDVGQLGILNLFILEWATDLVQKLRK